MTLDSKVERQPARVAGRLLAAAMTGLVCACASTSEPEAEPSVFVRIPVERNELGLIEPSEAYAEANRICSARLRTAVYFRGEDLGSDRRLLYFRCE